MELEAAAVAADLADDRVSVLHRMLMHRVAHVTEEGPRNDMLDADLDALLRHIDELLIFRRHIANAEHAGRV